MDLRVRDKHLVRECLAEFIGTFILMVFGTGVGSQFILSYGKLASAVSSSVTWGIGVMMGIYVSGGVSGGHINPAVSVAMACLGRLPWKKVPYYCVAQCLGSFAASGFVFLVYWDALDAFDGGFRQVAGLNATAGIWSTYPQSYVSVWTSLGDQNELAHPCCRQYLVPKARKDVTQKRMELYNDYNFFWVNIIGPHVGAVLGAYIYQAFIGFHGPLPPSVDIPIGDRDNDQPPPVTDTDGGKADNNSSSVKDRDKKVTSEENELKQGGVVNKAFRLPKESVHM